MHRAHQDDRTAALLRDHAAQAGARGKEAAVQMNSKNPFPVGKGDIGDRVEVLHAGVTDQDVDAVQPARGVRDPALHLGLVGHVHAHRDGAAPEFRRDALGAVDVGNAHRGAFGCERSRNGGADAARRPGNDRRFALQLHIGTPTENNPGTY